MPKLTIQQLAARPVLSKHFPANRLARINEALQIHATSDLGNSPLPRKRKFRQEGNLVNRLLLTKKQFNERVLRTYPDCFMSLPSTGDIFAKRQQHGKNLDLVGQMLNHNLPPKSLLTEAQKALDSFNKYFELAKTSFKSNLK